jgi:hypothetical protein
VPPLLLLTGFPDPGCKYPVLLRFAVFVGVVWTMRDLSDGSETTTTAVHISAVHHASVVVLVLDKNDTRTEVGR